MIKILIGITCLIICTYVGYMLSEKYVVKRKYYTAFNSFNGFFKGQVGFAKTSLKELVSKYSEESDYFYKNLYLNISKGNKVYLDQKIFTQEETDYLENYLDFLGSTDSKIQLDFLAKTESELSEQLKKAIENEEKYKSVYLKIGFLIGLIVLVVVV